MATISDVARAAGVSISTVSRVLSPGPVPHPVAPETAERVRTAARELNFTPSPLARGLAARLCALQRVSHRGEESAANRRIEIEMRAAGMKLEKGPRSTADMQDFHPLVDHHRRRCESFEQPVVTAPAHVDIEPVGRRHG